MNSSDAALADFAAAEDEVIIVDEEELSSPDDAEIEVSEDVEGNPEDDETMIVVDEDGDGDVDQVFRFDMAFLPGSDLEEQDAISVEEPEDEVEVEEKDMWDWKSGGLKNFLPWLHHMANNVPSHTGHDTPGIERASAYLDNLDRAISQAVRSDIRGELDINQVTDARRAVRDGNKRLKDRLDALMGKKKKAQTEEQLVKNAQKITGVGHVVVTVPLLISRIARVCINGMVSAGHDIEDMFDKQASKYDLSEREQAELLQLLEDMGYPMRRDRGFERDETIDIRKSDNFDWAAQYHA